jgi:hypothetical protein
MFIYILLQIGRTSIRKEFETFDIVSDSYYKRKKENSHFKYVE